MATNHSSVVDRNVVQDMKECENMKLMRNAKPETDAKRETCTNGNLRRIGISNSPKMYSILFAKFACLGMQ